MSALAESTDLELLALARAGQRDAYGQLVARHQTMVASLAYSVCGDFRRSQDIAQEAFVTAWQQLGSLQEATKFKGWLCGITRNLSHNFVRQQARRPDQPVGSADSPVEPADESPGPRDQAVTHEEAAIVWQSLEALPEAYREPLILFYREHQSIERVAAALDLNTDTVKQRLSRGRGLLRDQVENLIDRSLGSTTPGVMFTTAVLAALPAAGIAIATGATATTAKGGATAKSLFTAAWSFFTLVPLIDLLFTYFASRQLLSKARTPTERTFLRRYMWIPSVGFTLAIVAVLALMQWEHARTMEDRAQAQADIALHRHHDYTQIRHDTQLVSWLMMSALGLAFATCVFTFVWGFRRYADFMWSFRLPADAPPWRKRFWLGPDQARIWRTKLTCLGLPLIDISFGHSPAEPFTRGTARGWIALGDNAHGIVFALGGFATGGIAVGGVAVGLVSAGGVALGGIALGCIPVGGVADGMVAFGYIALGGIFAVGYEAATGFFAFARYFAQGDAWNFNQGGIYLAAAHTGDASAQDWFVTNAVPRAFKAAEYPLMFLLYALIPVIFIAATYWVVRRRNPGI